MMNKTFPPHGNLYQMTECGCKYTVKMGEMQGESKKIWMEESNGILTVSGRELINDDWEDRTEWRKFIKILGTGRCVFI